MKDNELLKQQIFEAFKYAIEKIGLEEFKKTSFFGSNQR